MTSALVRMLRVESVIDRTSLPAISGAASIAHSEKWARCSDSVKPGWAVARQTSWGSERTNFSLSFLSLVRGHLVTGR